VADDPESLPLPSVTLPDESEEPEESEDVPVVPELVELVELVEVVELVDVVDWLAARAATVSPSVPPRLNATRVPVATATRRRPRSLSRGEFMT
jgi:hypothetical protein